jgi:hypothetical protein
MTSRRRSSPWRGAWRRCGGTREGLGVPLLGVVMRQLWIEAQATAMSERVSFEDALTRILRDEEGDCMRTTDKAHTEPQR